MNRVSDVTPDMDELWSLSNEFLGTPSLRSISWNIYTQFLLAALLISTTLFLYGLYYVWSRFCSYQGIPKKFPFAGVEKNSWRARFRSSRNSAFGLRDLLWDGYQQHSREGRPFILPNIVTGHELILPPENMPWVLEQPDSVLSQFETNKQFLSADYTMPHPSLENERQVLRVTNQIKREITKELDTVADDMVDEIQDALRETWGSNTEKWNQLDLHSIMQEIVGRVVNRVFVGLPLCRHPGYLQCTIKFAQLVNVAATFINLTPRLLQPFIAPLLTAYDSFQYWRIASYVLPLIRDRAAQFSPGTEAAAKESGYPQQVAPNDFIQWAIRDAYRHGEDPCEPTHVISKRLAVITWAAIQSSAITITNALIDIAHSPDCDAILDELRAEALAASQAEPAATRWSRAALARLPKMDSVLTESLRLWGFVTRGVTKTVVAKGGITIPTGEHLPYGSKVGIANYGPQHDERVYGPGSPFQFDAFRFSRGKQDGPLSGLSFVTTGEYYMGFSHGRHACPGRYFANHQVKLLLAQIVLRYDIEPVNAPRPLNPWLNNSSGPPIGATLKVRRRKFDLLE